MFHYLRKNILNLKLYQGIKFYLFLDFAKIILIETMKHRIILLF